MNHGFRHILGCLLPILLLFLLPALGLSSGTTFTIAIVLMFGCHLLMMGGHDHGDDGDDAEPPRADDRKPSNNKPSTSKENPL